MPRGVPVATVAINNATNAGLLAVRILGVRDFNLQTRLGIAALFIPSHTQNTGILRKI